MPLQAFGKVYISQKYIEQAIYSANLFMRMLMLIPDVLKPTQVNTDVI